MLVLFVIGKEMNLIVLGDLPALFIIDNTAVFRSLISSRFLN